MSRADSTKARKPSALGEELGNLLTSAVRKLRPAGSQKSALAYAQAMNIADRLRSGRLIVTEATDEQ